MLHDDATMVTGHLGNLQTIKGDNKTKTMRTSINPTNRKISNEIIEDGVDFTMRYHKSKEIMND